MVGDTGSEVHQKKKGPEKMIMDGKNTHWAEIENKLQGTV